MTIPRERFEGGARLWRATRFASILGIALMAVGFLLWPRQSAFSYLVAFTYWTGIAVAALMWLGIFYASGASWMVVLRRPLEWMAASILPCAVLFLPLLLFVPRLFSWANPLPDGFPEHLRHALENKQAHYLHLPGFVLRGAVYFVLWGIPSWLLLRGSRSQDEGAHATERLRWVGTACLPPAALAMTFAAFDWLMSLDPLWFSTLFGVYYFAGSFLAALAVLTLCAVYGRGPGLWGAWVTTAHLHNLGKLLLGFTAFWAYIAFSQFMLIWSANLPEEVTWYQVRGHGPWRWWSALLAVTHFVIPFLALLSRRLKETPRLLASVAMWLLLAHFLDLYWLVMPALSPEGPAPHVLDLAAMVGVGGLCLSFALWLARGAYAVPVGDPSLPDSLRYTQP
jgi:hypothetical protein